MATNAIKDAQWQTFQLSEYFKLKRGTRLVKYHRVAGDTPLATAGHENQGIASFITSDTNELFSNAITIDMFGEAFYRGYEFYCDDNIHVLFPLVDISKFTKLFIVVAINSNKHVFGYGKQYRTKTFERQKVSLPVGSDGAPDWQLMDCHMKNIQEELLKNSISHFEKQIASLNSSIYETSVNWKEVPLENIFDFIQRGKRLIKSNQIPGNIPYISSTATRNGVDNFIANNSGVRHFSDGITIANSGSVGATFYHSYPFIASDHVTVLRSAKATPHSYLFIVTALSRLGEKYAFNREMSDTRIRREKIVLPVDSGDTPDWDYMDAFMRQQEINNTLRWLKAK